MLFDGFVGSDEPGRIVGAEEVPSVKAGEILKGAEEFVAADCGGKSVGIGAWIEDGVSTVIWRSV